MAIAVSAAEWTAPAGKRGNSSPWMPKPVRIRVATAGAVARRFHSTAPQRGPAVASGQRRGTGEPFQRLVGASPGRLRPTPETGGEPFLIQPNP